MSAPRLSSDEGGEAEHSGGLRIDDQLELVLFDNWQLRRLGANVAVTSE